MYPFYSFTGNRYFRTLDSVIPKLATMNVANSTTAITFSICPKVWCRLPKEGVIVLEVRQTPDTTAASLPVSILPTCSVSTAANTNAIPLVDAASKPITGSTLTAGNRYLIYYNKCDNVMQMMNYFVTAPAA